MMKNLFEQSRSHWVRYDHYELKTAENSKRYITPGKSAKPETEVEKAVMEFVTRYGLLDIQMMFSFMLVDSDQPLRLCKH